MKYYIKTMAGTWEDVNEHVFTHRQFVVNDANDGPRYSENYVVQDGSTINFNCNLEAEEFGHICWPVSMVSKPEFVLIRKGSSQVLHTLATGENWSKVA